MRVGVIALIALLAALSVVAGPGCADQSVVGAPKDADQRQGYDRFRGGWEAEGLKPVLYLERRPGGFWVTVGGNSAKAQGEGTDIVVDLPGSGTVRAHLDDRDHITVRGPGVRKLWRVKTLTMRRFSAEG